MYINIKDIKNKNINPKYDDMVGFIDVSEVRSRLIHKHLFQHESHHHLETALTGGTIGTIGGVILMDIFLNLLKN